MESAAARRKSGLFWVGAGLLYVCSLLWLFSIIRIIVKPEDAVDEILGMNILTITPILIGIYLIRREMKLRAPGKEFKCTNCGFLNRGDSEFCKSCGAVLKRGGEDGITVAIVLGCVLTLLGIWLGIACAAYLLTRKQPRARYHGRIQIVLLFLMNIVWTLVAYYVHTT